MMEQSVFKIGEVSARLGLVDKNSNTLRGWTEEFKEFLSTSANPLPGQPRRYTARDVQVLTAVREYRANHLSYEEIRDRLRAGEHEVTGPPSDDAPSYQDAPFATGGQALVPLAQVETLLAPLAASADEWRRLAEEYRTRLEVREARIEALERRVEELYERLDTRRDGAGGIAVPAAEGSAVPVAMQEPVLDAPSLTANGALPPEERHPVNGAGPETGLEQVPEIPAAAQNLFPLPAVERALWTEDEGVATVGEARRPWWRVWR